MNTTTSYNTMNDRLAATQPIVALALRWALGLAFLSAVADRLGFWGHAGAEGVSWGNFTAFLEYTALLNPFVPETLIFPLGLFVTITEVVLAAALILGLWTRQAALASGVLIILFAAGMLIGLGIKPPLDYSVFTAAGAALLLATVSENGWGMDRWLQQRRAASSCNEG